MCFIKIMLLITQLHFLLVRFSFFFFGGLSFATFTLITVYYQKKDSSLGGSSLSDKSSAVKSNSTPSTPQGEGSDFHTESRLSEGSALADQIIETMENREAHEDSFHEIETPETRIKMIDQMEILREQQKTLSEEMAQQSRSFKLLSEEAAKAPQNEEIKVIFAICL
jgi:centromeric protein E